MPVVTWTDDGAGNPISNLDEADQLAARRRSSMVAVQSQAWMRWSPILNDFRSANAAKFLGEVVIRSGGATAAAAAKFVGYVVITGAPFWRRQGPWPNPGTRRARPVQDWIFPAPSTLYGGAQPPFFNPPVLPLVRRPGPLGFIAGNNLPLILAAGDEVIVTALW